MILSVCSGICEPVVSGEVLLKELSPKCERKVDDKEGPGDTRSMKKVNKTKRNKPKTLKNDVTGSDKR